MPSVGLGLPPVSDGLYHGYEDVDVVPPELYTTYDVKRGLRNADGSGVLVGLTTISNVHGYNRTDHGIEPDEGDLIYRGYHVADLIGASQGEDRFGLRGGRVPAHCRQTAHARGARRLPCPHPTRASSSPRATSASSPRATYSHNIMTCSSARRFCSTPLIPTPTTPRPRTRSTWRSPCSAAGPARRPSRTPPTRRGSRTEKLVVPPGARGLLDGRDRPRRPALGRRFLA